MPSKHFIFEIYFQYFNIAGRYKDGVPDGWCWIIPPDNQDSVVYLRFKHGLLDTRRAALVDLVQETAWVGTYKIGERVEQTQKSFKFILDGSTHKLVKASRIKKLEYTDIGCVKRLRLPGVSEKSGVELELPVRVQLSGGRLSIISSRLLMFNRVAKVGSQSLIKLLFKLNDKNKFNVHVDQRAEEVMTDLEEYFVTSIISELQHCSLGTISAGGVSLHQVQTHGLGATLQLP